MKRSFSLIAFRQHKLAFLTRATLLILGLGSTCAARADDKAARDFIEQHCADCHDASEKKGGFDITTLKPEFTNAENFAQWVKVHDHVASGEMSPEKKAAARCGQDSLLRSPGLAEIS